MITVTSTLETTRPKTGVPLLESRPNFAGKRLSLAIAKGICPDKRIQPLRAPKLDMAAPAATA